VTRPLVQVRSTAGDGEEGFDSGGTPAVEPDPSSRSPEIPPSRGRAPELRPPKRRCSHALQPAAECRPTLGSVACLPAMSSACHPAVRHHRCCLSSRRSSVDPHARSSSNAQASEPSGKEPKTAPLVKEQRSRAALLLAVPWESVCLGAVRQPRGGNRNSLSTGTGAREIRLSTRPRAAAAPRCRQASRRGHRDRSDGGCLVAVRQSRNTTSAPTPPAAESRISRSGRTPPAVSITFSLNFES
jgi:hypothetical protein